MKAPLKILTTRSLWLQFLKEENKNLLTILKGIVATNESFCEKDLPKAQKRSASLNLDNAHAGKKFNQTTERGQ
jgi:hypothetical protein